MLVRRMGQFLLVYLLGIAGLLGLKYGLRLSDYIIPAPVDIANTLVSETRHYAPEVMDTLSVAVIGQVVSVILALTVGILGRRATWFGSFVKVAAYNTQSYPIVAIAPVIFILLGDGFLSRLVIAAMICYFPLLLSVIGIMSEPVRDMEHFYRATGRMTWRLEVGIRAFENLNKLTTVVSGSATLAMAGTIVSEFIAAREGIGYSIRVALYQSDMAKVLAALFFIGIILSVYQGLLEWTGEAIRRRWSDG